MATERAASSRRRVMRASVVRCIARITLESAASQQCSRHSSPAESQGFLHAMLTVRPVAYPIPAVLAERCGGFCLHPRLGRPLSGDSLADRCHLAARTAPMNVIYALSALLTAALLVYLLYALIRPEKF